MSEKPIIFSGPMVRAIREGRKTQTRRIVKGEVKSKPVDVRRRIYNLENDIEEVNANLADTDARFFRRIASPYRIGDRLWVRETWAECTECGGVVYRVNGEHAKCENCADGYGGRWRPSVHMPRRAARTFLTVTGVRVERVQDISEADASAEGVERIAYGPFEIDGHPVHPMTSTYYDAFAALWTSIHGPGAWERNDWVWVYEIERGKA
jgi:hypothetical protein